MLAAKVRWKQLEAYPKHPAKRGCKTMNEFTDRIRMEIVPELEARLILTQKAIRKNDAFTRDYKAGVKDNLLCGATFLNAILDEIDEIERELDEMERELEE